MLPLFRCFMRFFYLTIVALAGEWWVVHHRHHFLRHHCLHAQPHVQCHLATALVGSGEDQDCFGVASLDFKLESPVFPLFPSLFIHSFHLSFISSFLHSLSHFLLSLFNSSFLLFPFVPWIPSLYSSFLPSLEELTIGEVIISVSHSLFMLFTHFLPPHTHTFLNLVNPLCRWSSFLLWPSFLTIMQSLHLIRV